MIRYTICTFSLCTALLIPSAFAQGTIDTPTITNIPGGFFVEWAAPVDVAAVLLDKRWNGTYEIMFDVPNVNFITNVIDRRTPSTNTPEMVAALTDYWIDRGRPERAIPLYERALQQGNLDAGRALIFQNNLAMLYSRVLGQHDRALEAVNAALETRRDNVVLLDTKGLILLNSGNPEEAIPVLEQAVVLSCQLPIYCMHLAFALHQASRSGQARRFFDPVRDQLIEAGPDMTQENKAMLDELLLVLPPI